jgi:hypothetical protein
MASRMKTSSGKVTVKAQRSDAASEALVKVMHAALPWFAWAGLSAAGSVLRLGLWIGARGALLWAGLLFALTGLVVAVFDFQLRKHRAAWQGRWIGPATALACGLFTCLYLVLGPLDLVLDLAWLAVGVIGCLAWDGWAIHGDQRDLAATFNAGSDAAGVAGAKMAVVSRRPVEDEDDGRPLPDLRAARGRSPRPRRRSPRPGSQHEVVEAGIQLPADPAMTADEVGDRMGHIEVVTGSRPGSMALTSSPDRAGLASVRITDPDLLTAAPIPWPGPYAPGADMTVPFRLARLQTGQPFLLPRLPVFHMQVTGKTGAAKTMGLCWNIVAEGITREGYSMVAFDVVKGEQFLGALRPSLHALATAPEQANLLLHRLHRARLDRCNYLGANHVTEWYDGCGLSFMDIWLEEAAGVLKLLATSRNDIKDGIFPLADYVEDVNAARSAGMSWWNSYQKPDKTQARSTVARGQMGHVCFGVEEKDDARMGLSELQRERGCRPELWTGPQHKAMAFMDAETLDERTKVTPMRFYNWGPGSERIGAYCAEYQARDRPWDDVTGEAMAWTPAISPSAAFPQASGWATGNGNGAHDNGGPGKLAPKIRSQLEAEERLRKLILRWAAQGLVYFELGDLQREQAHVGKGRTWFYSAVPKLASEQNPLVREVETDPETGGALARKRWLIIANDPARPEPRDTTASQDDDEEGAA